MGVKKISKTNTEMIEIGDTGTLRNTGYTFEEFVPELRSRNGAEIYDEMRKNDTTINGVLTLMNQLFYNVSWKYENKKIDDNSQYRSEIIEQMLNDMEKTFTQTMNDALTFLHHGYSLLEIVWKIRLGLHSDLRFYSKHNYKDGLWAPRKLPLRSQKTILRWEFDPAGTPIGAYQRIPSNGREVFIPAERLLHFRTTTEGDLPEGISILRGCYESYETVKKIRRIEAISIERDLAGIPVVYAPASIMSKKTDENRKQFENLASQIVNIRNNSQAGILLPSNVYENTNHRQFQFELVKAAGQKQIDTNTIIERYESNIVIQLLADFMYMGAKKAGGTYNLAEVKIKLFAKSLNYYLDVVQDVINDNLIRQIYIMNNWPLDKMVKIKHGNIDTIDFEVFAKSIMELVQCGALTPDQILEKELRERGNIPQLVEDINDV
nr:hypothetical protein GTC16762_33370 [Pigmentibacter ruber]